MGLTSPHMEAFSTARSSAASIYKLIDRISNIDSLSPAGVKPNTMKGEILFEDVHFRYPSRPTVKVCNIYYFYNNFIIQCRLAIIRLHYL